MNLEIYLANLLDFRRNNIGFWFHDGYYIDNANDEIYELEIASVWFHISELKVVGEEWYEDGINLLLDFDI